jgi:hypothetical protein
VKKAIYFIGAGFTKALQARMPVPVMMDFVQVMAHYAKRDDVVLMALIGLEGQGCFSTARPALKALANDIRPKRHRRKLLTGILGRPQESIEALLAKAERIERRLKPMSKRGLLAAINDPVLRAQYAITRMFYKIGWRVRTREFEEYLKRFVVPAGKQHTFVSFNYDLVLEHCLEVAGTSWSARHGYGAAFRWAVTDDPSEGGGTPVEPLVGGTSSRLVVLKPHGSLNWLAPVGRPGRLPVISATAGGHVRYVGSTVTHPSVRFPDELPVRVAPFILPPTSAKQTHMPLLCRLRRQEVMALAKANELYVIGWSIPKTDVDQVRLIEEAVAQRRQEFSRVVVVNYGQHEAYYSRVARIFGVRRQKIEQYNEGVSQFLAAELARAG